MASSTQLVLVFILVAVTIANAFPQYNPQHHHNNNRKNSFGDIDNIPSATGHGHHNGRVQIKVYRGQSKGHGHYESFAPYGYWVRQPPDNHGHGHHY